MKKNHLMKTVAAASLAFILAACGNSYGNGNGDGGYGNTPAPSSSSSQTQSGDSMEKGDSMEHGDSMEKGDSMEHGDKMEKEGATTKPSAYVTYEDFQANLAAFQDQKLVYFFAASWCPVCEKIDKDLKSNTSLVPQGTTVVRVDFDNSRDLRAKYGVTTQYTFVQVDAKGNEINKWQSARASDIAQQVRA